MAFEEYTYRAELREPLPAEVSGAVLGAWFHIHESRDLERVVFHMHRSGQPSVKVTVERVDTPAEV